MAHAPTSQQIRAVAGQNGQGDLSQYARAKLGLTVVLNPCKVTHSVIVGGAWGLGSGT